MSKFIKLESSVAKNHTQVWVNLDYVISYDPQKRVLYFNDAEVMAITEESAEILVAELEQ